ncbi:MAG: hypothetical protein EXQ56_10205 [Acidobacteria bacterium]|nr:hypothetical protein [Acidobacteriota bacterium]
MSPRAVSERIVPPRGLAVRIVLVQPRNPLNILAAARAARNFGLGDIAVVGVHAQAWAEAIEKDKDRETPHGPRGSARGWLGDARCYAALDEAIGDCNWVLGTSSLDRRAGVLADPAAAGSAASPRSGTPLDASQVIDLNDLPARLATSQSGRAASRFSTLDSRISRLPSQTPNPQSPIPALIRDRVAILFGSEKRGLTNDHLARCQHLLRIPTVAALPSMNLGQAVAVVCYELSRSGVLAGEMAGEIADSASEKLGNRKLAEESLAAESGVATGAEAQPHLGSAVESDVSSEVNSRSKESTSTRNSGKPKLTKLLGSAKLAEAADKSNRAASARQVRALMQQLFSLTEPKSSSSEILVEFDKLSTRQRNLHQMINRLPLTERDVSLILALVKVVRTAKTVKVCTLVSADSLVKTADS